MADIESATAEIRRGKKKKKKEERKKKPQDENIMSASFIMRLKLGAQHITVTLSGGYSDSRMKLYLELQESHSVLVLQAVHWDQAEQAQHLLDRYLRPHLARLAGQVVQQILQAPDYHVLQ